MHGTSSSQPKREGKKRERNEVAKLSTKNADASIHRIRMRIQEVT